jgi:hypothetical protein
MFKMRSGTNNLIDCTFIVYSFFFLIIFFVIFVSFMMLQVIKNNYYS